MIILRNQKLYLASLHSDLDRDVMIPMVPNDEASKRGLGKTKLPRTTFYPSIDLAISGLGEGLTGKVVYIYEPVGRINPLSKTYPSPTENPFQETQEVWCLTTTRLKLVTKVRVNRKIKDNILKQYTPRLVTKSFPKWSWSDLTRKRKTSKVVWVTDENKSSITLKPEIKFYKSISDAVKNLENKKVGKEYYVYKPKDDSKLEIIPTDKDELLYDKPIKLFQKAKILITSNDSYKTC